MASPKKAEQADRQARILIDAILTGDDQLTADKYQISTRSIERWRSRVLTDGGRESLLLAETVQQKLAALNVDWGTSANAALVAGMQFLTKAAQTIEVSAASVRAIAGAVKLVGELSALNRTIEAKLAKPAPVSQLQAMPSATARKAG